MITYYEFKGGKSESWSSDPIELGNINLLVGTSGSGKTRFLNTLFNFAEYVSKGKPFRSGNWKLKLKLGEYEYCWEYEGVLDEQGASTIVSEKITRMKENEETIIKRDINDFYFYEQKLPKLEKDILSVTLLKEEDSIRPLYKIFSHMLRRRFHDDALNIACSYENISKELIERIKKRPDFEKLWGEDHPIQSRMYFLKEFFKDKYSTVTEFFKQTFPTVEEIDVRFLKDSPFQREGLVPILLVKEKGVKDWIPLIELSSGMQKVLLIILDIIYLPAGSVYIIDEYENSLGINAINFLPEFLTTYGAGKQYFITTHHPYLINNMPVKNWLVFFRRGSNVLIRSGREFEEQFGKSKQKSFIQLLNNPFYLEGKK